MAVPINIVKANFSIFLERAKVQTTEIDPSTIEFRSYVHILFAKHPLSCVSKGSIYFKKVQEDITEIDVTLSPASLRGFAILFPTLFIFLMTFFGHWVIGMPLQVIVSGMWTVDICVAAGAYLIYLLIKQSVINYFNRLVKETRSLVM